MDRIDQKLDKIVETLGMQAVTLGKLTTTVEEHVKRTNLLEKIVLSVQTKINNAEGAVKFVGLLGTIAAIMEGIALWIKH